MREMPGAKKAKVMRMVGESGMKKDAMRASRCGDLVRTVLQSIRQGSVLGIQRTIRRHDVTLDTLP